MPVIIQYANIIAFRDTDFAKRKHVIHAFPHVSIFQQPSYNISAYREKKTRYIYILIVQLAGSNIFNLSKNATIR